MSTERLHSAVTRPLAWLLVPALMALAGCRQDMHDAPRYDPLEASAVFARGASARPLVEGTIARGHLGDDDLLATGKVGGTLADQFPFAIAAADLDRGQQRYDVFCAPCHSRLGDGQGMVVQRGYRMPPTFHDARLRQAPAGHFFDVITNGFGAMPDYRAQVPVADRWRIVAYIRALQLSQAAAASEVPDAEMARLRAGPPAGAQQ